jgi:hypothetical protein
MVVSLAAAMRRLTSNTMVVGLVTPAVSFHRGNDAGENLSLLGRRRWHLWHHFLSEGDI